MIIQISDNEFLSSLIDNHNTIRVGEALPKEYTLGSFSLQL